MSCSAAKRAPAARCPPPWWDANRAALVEAGLWPRAHAAANIPSGGAARASPRCQTGWDLALGALLVIAGFIVLGHTVVATAVSVLFIGWLTLISGTIALVAALFRIGKGGLWSTALSGGLLTGLGLMFVRNPAVAALTLTLIAGSLFLVSGVTRLVAAFQNDAYRWAPLFGGIVSTVLGLPRHRGARRRPRRLCPALNTSHLDEHHQRRSKLG